MQNPPHAEYSVLPGVRAADDVVADRERDDGDEADEQGRRRPPRQARDDPEHRGSRAAEAEGAGGIPAGCRPPHQQRQREQVPEHHGHA
jgi:hypothetical protein